jgi:putative peptide zinc metalloprotease protein
MDYRPELCENVVIAKIENDTKYFVHQVSHDVRLRVNAHTHYLLKLIDGERTVSELTILMRNHFNQNISQHEIDLFIRNTLEPNGILKTDREVVKKEPPAYLNFRITLIPHSVVSKITRYLQFLFFDRIWYFIGVLLFGLTILYISAISSRGLSNFVTPAHILSYIPLAVCSYIAHEFGHASACEKFGVKAGSIGFGFYILMPVFYADVSNAWRLSASKRIIINIAGMYFQLLLSCLLVFIYAITANEWMLYASLVNILSTLPNLNPFVRYDGYWILSDLLGMNNIMQKAEHSYKQTLGWFLGKMKGRFPISTPTDKFLIAYFLINKIMVVVLLLVFVIFNSSSVYYFPGKVFNFISSLLMEPEVRSFIFIKRFLVENLVSILFYIFLFRLIKGILVKKSSARLK